MKAIGYRNYGSPDVLHCEDVETPSPDDDEVPRPSHSIWLTTQINPVSMAFSTARTRSRTPSFPRP